MAGALLAARETGHGTALERPWDWDPSLYGSCPLCGCGEAGAEHLVLWCPAVARAWQLLGVARGRALAQAICEPDGDDHRAASFIHQASFLHSSLTHRAAMDWRTAAGWLTRACSARRERRWGHIDDDPEEDDDEGNEDWRWTGHDGGVDEPAQPV